MSYMEDQTGTARPQQVALRGFRFLREFVGGRDVSTFELCLGKADDDVAVKFHKLRENFVSGTPPASAPN